MILHQTFIKHLVCFLEALEEHGLQLKVKWNFKGVETREGLAGRRDYVGKGL